MPDREAAYNSDLAPPPPPPDSPQNGWDRVLPWLQLCRLPNVFTAVADPLAGALLVGARPGYVFEIVMVIIASACLYTGGVVLNDWHDYRRDLAERPGRPLPSGRIRRWHALVLACLLLAVGMVAAWCAGPTTLQVAVLLLIAIITYDVLLKHLPLAPGVMGLCRGLNVLMGMSLVPLADSSVSTGVRVFLAGVMAFYILGVTLFAQREAALKQDVRIWIGSIISILSLFTLGAVPILFPSQNLLATGYLWLIMLITALGFGFTRALLDPGPVKVQAAVRTAILGIILLDAAMVALFRGPASSVLIVGLLAPALWLGKRVYST